MNSIKDMVKDGKQVTFQFYKQNELWYETECGFSFPVPIADCGDGVFLSQDKAMLFMRYIRKHVAMLETARKESVETQLVTITKKIDEAVKENFGYAPSDPWFDELVDKRNELQNYLETQKE